jgi:hypothetical protein
MTSPLQPDSIADPNGDARRMQHFHALSREEQARAIRDLSSSGYSDDAIAAATRLSTEMVCRILAGWNR